MDNKNFLGTKWRNRRNHGIYTVKDQSEVAAGVPDIHENAMLTLEADASRATEPANIQAVITVRAGAINKFFTPLRTVTPGLPGVPPTVVDENENTDQHPVIA